MTDNQRLAVLLTEVTMLHDGLNWTRNDGLRAYLRNRLIKVQGEIQEMKQGENKAA